MKCKQITALISIILAAVALVFIYANRPSGTSHQLTENADVVDQDFEASIEPAANDYEFIIKVTSVNPKTDKQISLFPVAVGFVPIDEFGKELASGPDEASAYAYVVDGDFDKMRSAPVKSMQGKVRLITRDLRPGTYKIKPYIRIIEVGKDRLSGPYMDGGSIQAKAGNAVEVKVGQPWEINPRTHPNDVTDNDFAAFIAATDTPYVFAVEVKLINPKKHKAINSHHEIIVDLELIDKDGRVFAGDYLVPYYAENVGASFEPNDVQPYPQLRKGRVRLIRKKLPAGVYTVKPRVRIIEEGKDAVYGPSEGAGSVAIPSANSIKVTVE